MNAKIEDNSIGKEALLRVSTVHRIYPKSISIFDFDKPQQLKIKFLIPFFVFAFCKLHSQNQIDTIPYSSYADDGTFISENHGDFVSRFNISAGGEVNYFRNGGIGGNIGFSFFQPGKFYLQADWIALNSGSYGIFSVKGMYFIIGREDSVHRQVITGSRRFYNGKKQNIISAANVINKFYFGLHGGIAANYSSHTFPNETELSFGTGVLFNKNYKVHFAHINNGLLPRERSHKWAFYADACYYPQTSLDAKAGRFLGYKFYFDLTQSFFCRYDFGVNMKLGWSFDGYQMGPIVGMSLYGGF